MGRFALVGPSYTSQSKLADCQMTMNWILEAIESGQGRSAAAMYPTPGLALLYNFSVLSSAIASAQQTSFPTGNTYNFSLKQPLPLEVGQTFTFSQVAGPFQITAVTDNKTFAATGPVIGATFFEVGTILLNFAQPAAIRGEITAQGRTFVVAGIYLFELLAPAAVPNVVWRGNVVSDGLPVSLCNSGYQLLIASGGSSYVLNLNLNTLTAVDPSGGGNVPVAQVVYADGFFFALVMNPTTPWQINASNLNDATTWQAVSFAIVEVFSDNPTSIFVNQRVLWVFGPKGIQPYSNTGDFPFPFDVISGTYIENGLAARYSVAKLDNSLFWLGQDERGTGIVFRANGYTPQRVSNHAVEYAIQGYAKTFGISDAVAYAYQDNGHTFYVLSFPAADKTWVYDVATGQWAERGFWNVQPGRFNRHRAAFHTFNFGMHLVGDPTVGAVYQMDITILNDFGNPIRRVRRAPHISKEQKRIPHASLQVDVEVGIGPNLQGNLPATFFYVTDANGVNWRVSINDVGAFQLVPSNLGEALPLYFNDPVTNTSWQLVPSILGQLNPVSVPYNSSYPSGSEMYSQSGNYKFMVGVKQVAPGIGQILAIALGIVARGPLWVLRWSDDGGQTWSHEYARDGGALGQYKKRLLWNRLGSPRDRIYELSISEAVPARVIDAYLDAPGYQPTERLNKQIAKQA